MLQRPPRLHARDECMEDCEMKQALLGVSEHNRVLVRLAVHFCVKPGIA